MTATTPPASTTAPRRSTRKTVSNVLLGIDAVLVLGLFTALIWTATYHTEPVPGFDAAQSTIVIVGVLLGVIAGVLRRTPDDEDSSAS